MDLDGDGRRDLISGSYPGEVYLFRGDEKGGLAPPEKIKLRDGKDLKPGSASAVFAVDWDGDGDLDPIAGDIQGYVHLVPNEAGKGKPPAFDPPVKLKAGSRRATIQVAGGDAGPCVTDWDGEEGRFVIDDVDPDAERIVLHIEGYPPKVLERPKLTPGRDLEVTIRLELGGTVSGRALDAAGKPVEGAGVTVAEFMGPSAHAETDSGGHFRLTGVPAGRVEIQAYLAGPEMTAPRIARSAPVQVPSGGKVEGVVIAFPPE